MHPREFEMKITGQSEIFSRQRVLYSYSGGFLESVNVKLAYTDVIAFYFSFESQNPVALIQVRSEFARLFDRHIPTSDEKGRGFDPDSKGMIRKIPSERRTFSYLYRRETSSYYFPSKNFNARNGENSHLHNLSLPQRQMSENGTSILNQIKRKFIRLLFRTFVVLAEHVLKNCTI